MKPMKAKVDRPRAESRPDTDYRTFRTQVAEGDIITFDPTGEQLRVRKIEKGQITFEKLP